MKSLSPRWLCALGVLVATTLALPSLFVGFFYDDVMQLRQLDGMAAPHGGTFDLYNFAAGGAETEDLIAHGPLPWWTSPAFRMHFWRPLASAIIAAQYAIFGHRAVLFHAVSLLFQAALIVAVAALFRKTVPSLWVIGLFLFAIDDAHWDGVGWICAINCLLALLGGVLTSIAYRRYREEGHRASLGWALAAAAFTLLAGEAGIGALAYLAAYEMVGTPRRNLLRLWPFVPLLAAYVVVYRFGGYGARAHGGYLDPLQGGSVFLENAAQRVPALFGNLTLGLPFEVWWTYPASRWPFALASAVALLLLGLWMRSALARLGPDERRSVLWLSLGSLLSLLPSAAGPPGGRALFASSLGAAAALALLLRDGWSRLRDGGSRVLVRAAAGAGFGLVVLANVIAAPLLFGGKLLLMYKLSQYATHMVSETERLAAEGKPAPDGTRRVAVVSTDDPLTMIYVPYLRQGQGSAEPWRAFWPLSTATVPETLRRVDAKTLELSTTEHFFATEVELMLAGGRKPRLGDTVRLDGAEVRVVEERDGYPTRIDLRFDSAADLEQLRLVSWRSQEVHPMALPEIGEAVSLEKASYFSAR